MSDHGLREKKKMETRQALAESAFQLAKEHGVDNFIIEDIVQKAGYSRRTFANYFSCKEEAIANALTLLHSPLDFHYTVTEESLSPIDAIHFFIKHRFSLEILNRLHELVCLSKHHSTLRLYVNALLQEVQNYAKQGMIQKFGEAYPTSYYHLLMGAIFSALLPLFEEEISIQFPLTDQLTENQFFHYIDQIFEQLREGFN
ncbi:TetR/AcrR family transcriptional regulator [Bacillus sp. C1-1]|nr:TetR/AcrR family transcriptional regulator [Bacillus sp. C1-1]